MPGGHSHEQQETTDASLQSNESCSLFYNVALAALSNLKIYWLTENAAFNLQNIIKCCLTTFQHGKGGVPAASRRSTCLTEMFWPVGASSPSSGVSPACLSASRCARLVVGLGLCQPGEHWPVLRLCPHITTADCSSGWLGFSAKTGITDPCRLPTFTAATSMFTQSELWHPRELKEMCVCAFQRVWKLGKITNVGFFFKQIAKMV